MLYYASERAVSYWNPHEFYTEVNMNLWAWKYLREHLELIAAGKDKTDSASTVDTPPLP